MPSLDPEPIDFGPLPEPPPEPPKPRLDVPEPNPEPIDPEPPRGPTEPITEPPAHPRLDQLLDRTVRPLWRRWWGLRPWKRVVGTLLALFLMVSCCGLGTIATMIYRSAEKASQGGANPDAAVAGFLLTIEPGHGDLGVSRWVSHSAQQSVMASRKEIIDTMDKANRRYSITLRLESIGNPATNPPGKTATVTRDVRFTFWTTANSNSYAGHTEKWVFETVRESTGWKVSKVTHPPLCGSHFKAEVCA